MRDRRPAGRPRRKGVRPTVRVYVPFGASWLRYFLRRRAEAQGTG
ncbi:hypothetical protein [Baekduia alba]|nr:hypothetical protein [Baekduia alba]